MDDKALIRLLRRDPDAGLRAAMQVYAPLVKGVLAHILPRDAREVEEGVADVFVALWRNAAALEQSGAPLRGWLAVTARNTGIDRYRALRRQGELSLDDGLAETLGELARVAHKHDVQVIIEGPGHMPLNQIKANMEIEQSVCKGAPFYVLGPLVTDIAPGYDHITAAIGGAIAATYGASFLCYVTPAEHLRLPTVEDVREGIIASKIAAHAADIAKGIPGASDWDWKMSEARRELDWESQFRLAIDPEKARRYRAESTPEHDDTCTMCGKMCAVRNMNKILRGENVDIMD